jgi:hypothetical protein
VDNNLEQILNKVKQNSLPLGSNKIQSQCKNNYIDDVYEYFYNFNSCENLDSNNYYCSKLDENCPYVNNKTFFLCDYSECLNGEN